MLCFAWASLVAQLVKNLLQCGRPGLDPRVERSPGEGNGYQLQYSCLENSMDRGSGQATIHGFAELDTTKQLMLSLKLV